MPNPFIPPRRPVVERNRARGDATIRKAHRSGRWTEAFALGLMKKRHPDLSPGALKILFRYPHE